jgi:hypothetical protein
LLENYDNGLALREAEAVLRGVARVANEAQKP